MHEEYNNRLTARREAAARHERQIGALGNWRLAVAVAGALIAWWNYWLLPVPVAAFIALVILHERMARRAQAEKRAAAYYERGLARLDHVWAGAGPPGEQFRDPAHPYAEDLDLFGHGSLFQLISSARTAAGEATLANWLKKPASPQEVLSRHSVVEELQPQLDLREDLALLGDDIQAELHPAALLRWGTGKPVRFPPAARAISFALASATALAFSGYMLQFWTYRPFLIVILLQSIWGFLMRDRVLQVLHSADLPAHDLNLLSELLGRIERESFRSDGLVRLRARLATKGKPPSVQIRTLERLVEWHDWSHNQMFLPVARALLWSTQFAMAIESWRQNCGPSIGQWIEALGEIEALSSLSGYAYEHPDDTLPELVDTGPVYDAHGFAHPLLPDKTAVRNDLRLDLGRRLFVVSGSNMSGKSTMLRAVGLNAVLAWAGAPVRAEKLRISALEVGASIRVQDSLQDGKSRFYAEITRLRQIVDLAGEGTALLFLLDELLSGTNSHDRRIGAEAIVRTLADRGAIGLVTTHDLALAAVAESLAPLAANVHFEDHLEHGRIAFDFKLRTGVVQKSNALELMRSVGLSV